MKDENGNPLATAYQVELLERWGVTPATLGRDDWEAVSALEASELVGQHRPKRDDEARR